MPEQARRGQLYVVSAPSGVGKTTIIRSILPKWPGLRFSVSCTTRPPRPGEVHDKDYHFLSREKFLNGIQMGRFLEWAHVHGQYYGTDGEQVEDWLAAGNDVLLDIDVQGARQVRCAYPGARAIFVIPPSMGILQKRLQHRGTESPEQLSLRLATAEREIRQAPWYDFVVVNDALEEAVADFNAILRACRCDRFSQAWRLKPFVAPEP